MEEPRIFLSPQKALYVEKDEIFQVPQIPVEEDMEEPEISFMTCERNLAVFNTQDSRWSMKRSAEREERRPPMGQLNRVDYAIMGDERGKLTKLLSKELSYFEERASISSNGKADRVPLFMELQLPI